MYASGESSANSSNVAAQQMQLAAPIRAESANATAGGDVVPQAIVPAFGIASNQGTSTARLGSRDHAFRPAGVSNSCGLIQGPGSAGATSYRFQAA